MFANLSLYYFRKDKDKDFVNYKKYKMNKILIDKK